MEGKLENGKKRAEIDEKKGGNRRKGIALIFLHHPGESPDCVLSHWAHFTMHRFICVYLCVFRVFLFHTANVLYYCEHGGVDLMGLKSNP